MVILFLICNKRSFFRNDALNCHVLIATLKHLINNTPCSRPGKMCTQRSLYISIFLQKSIKNTKFPQLVTFHNVFLLMYKVHHNSRTCHTVKISEETSFILMLIMLLVMIIVFYVFLLTNIFIIYTNGIHTFLNKTKAITVTFISTKEPKRQKLFRSSLFCIYKKLFF